MITDTTTAPRRSHAHILRDYGVAKVRTLLSERGHALSATAPQRWADRSSIPGEYWNLLSGEGVATLEELAEAAEARKTAS